MQSYYRINVSKKGRYLFATEQDHLVTECEAREIVKLFREKFPESEGYKISVIHWETVGYHRDL